MARRLSDFVFKTGALLGLMTLTYTFNSAFAEATAADAEIEEVVVTGSYIKRKNQSDLASPINVLGLEKIQENGWTDIEDISETFTFNTSSVGRSDLAGGCCGTARGIDIRALGVASTLVLQNGKRVASTSSYEGADYTNIKALMPVIAMDRMETLLDGSAALYGSDAVAGVVNLIPRKDFEGIEARIGGKAIDKSGQHEAQVLVGAQGDRVSGIFAVSFEHTDHMLNKDRPFTLLNNTSSYGSPGTHVLQGRPQSSDGSDLIIDTVTGGLVNYSQLYDDNASAAGTLQVADPHCYPELVPAFGPIPGGGQPTDSFPLGLCKSTYQPHNSITPEEDTYLVYTLFNVEISDSMDLDLEYSGYRRESYTGFIATFPQTNGSPVVPASNPLNPFGVDTEWRGRFMGLAYPHVGVNNDGSANRFSATLNGDLGAFTDANWAQSWTFNISLQHSIERNTGEAPDTDLRAIQYGLNGFGGALCNVRFDGPAATEVAGQGNCYYMSPFGKDIYRTPGNPSSGYGAVVQVDATTGALVYPDQATTWEVLRYSAQAETMRLVDERTLGIFEAVATGDLFEMGGGMAAAAIGFQMRDHHRELFVSNFGTTFSQGFLSPNLPGAGGRNVTAIFGEVVLPITEYVEINAAIRNEDYGNISSTDPKVSARFTGIDGITLRASYGTSFRAASLGQTTGNDSNSRVFQTYDPLHPDEDQAAGIGTFRTILVGKNRDLEPEESTNYNIGASWIPEAIQGFQADFDYFSYKFENRVSVEGAIDVLNSDPCGPKVVRDTTSTIPGAVNLDKFPGCPAEVGPVIIVNTSYFNSGTTEVDGFDVTLNYNMNLLGGDLTATWVSTYINTYDIQSTDGGPVIDAAGWRNFSAEIPVPQLRSNVILSYFNGQHGANLTARYVSEIKDDIAGRSAGLPDIESQTEIDVQYSYSFGENDAYSIHVGAQNLMDEMPPDAPFAYLARVHNPYGRQLYARFGVKLD